MPIKKFPTVMPTIYDKFQCKGGACRNTCCQQWEINITRGEYNKLRHRIKDEKMQSLFHRVPRKEAVDDRYALVELDEEGYCPYLTDSKMCGLQLEHGYPILPNICKLYPRIYKQINPELHAFSLDTGCERTLELLWEEAENGLRFTSDMRDNLGLLSRDSVAPEFAGFSDYISDIQNLCIWLLQNRDYSLSDRMLILGLAMRELQEIEDAQAAERIPEWFVKWQAHTKGSVLAETLSQLEGNRQWFLMNNSKLLLGLRAVPSMKKFYPSLAEHIDLVRQPESFSCNADKYHALDTQFAQQFPNIDHFFENYMVLTLFRLIFPFNQASVWQSYLYLCSFYSLMRFVAVAAAPHSIEELIDALSILSRTCLNMNYFSNFTAEQLDSSDSSSLAHMAILLRG